MKLIRFLRSPCQFGTDIVEVTEEIDEVLHDPITLENDILRVNDEDDIGYVVTNECIKKDGQAEEAEA